MLGTLALLWKGKAGLILDRTGFVGRKGGEQQTGRQKTHVHAAYEAQRVKCSPSVGNATKHPCL